MKTVIPFVLLILFVSGLRADDIVRDENGKIISTSTHTATGTIVRDPAGAMIEHREARTNTDGSKTIVVRDEAGKVVREEDKARK